MLKLWYEETFYQAGQPLALKLKAPLFSDGPEFLRKMTAVSRAVGVARNDPESSDSIFTALDPEWVKGLFAKWVRPVAPIEVEGEAAIESGEGLFGVVSSGVVVQVLFKLQKLALLTEAEGKASSSPSTSEPAGTSGAGGSPATSTENGDGPTP